jgi:hypothetical protein
MNIRNNIWVSVAGLSLSVIGAVLNAVAGNLAWVIICAGCMTLNIINIRLLTLLEEKHDSEQK